MSDNADAGTALVTALKQVVATPKIEYMHFDGDPIKFPSFIHNFETCLEKNSSSEESKLQLLIQHCRGKAREAIESCVNLPVEEGYRTAKDTLQESFGKPHIIAGAHIRMLIDLPNIKRADGSSLLEFARHLDSTNRALKGMGTQYVSDLDHVNTLKELNRKLPVFLRARWAENAGKIYEKGSRPQFADFLNFIKKRAALMNNEFGDDLGTVDKEKQKKDKDRNGRPRRDKTSFVAGVKDKDNGKLDEYSASRSCQMCSEQHGIWQCKQFKQLSVSDRKKKAADKALCFKCLGAGHYARLCPRKHFRCRAPSCGKEHHTLLHSEEKNTRVETKELQPSGNDGENKVVAATGAGESRVCLGVLPVKVRPKNGIRSVETYALLDSGSEVTICSEKLARSLNVRGETSSFNLIGITGSQSIESQLIDMVVESMDGSTIVELEKVRTVKDIPVSSQCIPKKQDLEKWSHLQNVNLHEVGEEKVMLIIGLKENPQLFLPLEYKVGETGEPVGVRYSLGWTVMGPVGDEKEGSNCSVNLIQSSTSANVNLLEQVERFTHVNPSSTNIQSGKETQSLSCIAQIGGNIVEFSRPIDEHANMITETEFQDYQDRTLKQQIEGLWKTDFGDTLVNTRPSHSAEDRRALDMMKSSFVKVNGHYQVALPWRSYPPRLYRVYQKKVNNYKMAYKSNMQLNFDEFFVNMDILRSSDDSDTKTFLKILHPTARGVVFKHHLKHASRKRMVGLKHKFHS